MEKKIVWSTVDYHVGGEPVRIIEKGIREPKGSSMLEKRQEFMKEPLVSCTIREPRGHAGMYAAMLTAPVERESSFGVIFACNERCFPMFCGHAFLGAVYYAVQEGIVNAKLNGETRFYVDVPSGTVEAVVTRKEGEIVKTAFVNQPCFILKENTEIILPEIGRVTVDIVWSGSFMAYVSAGVVGETLGYDVVPQALAAGYAIETALKKEYDFYNPLKPEYRMKKTGALVCFVTEPERQSEHIVKANTLNIIDRNNYDRGAAGTATCGRLALFEKRGQIKKGDSFYNYCLTGQHYTATLLEQKTVLGIPAIIPELTADVYEMGRSTFFLTEKDPFPEGMQI